MGARPTNPMPADVEQRLLSDALMGDDELRTGGVYMNMEHAPSKKP